MTDKLLDRLERAFSLFPEKLVLMSSTPYGQTISDFNITIPLQHDLYRTLRKDNRKAQWYEAHFMIAQWFRKVKTGSSLLATFYDSRGNSMSLSSSKDTDATLLDAPDIYYWKLLGGYYSGYPEEPAPLAWEDLL